MQRTYDLTGRGTAISTITLRRLTGADYYAALERAEGPDHRRVTGLDVKTEAIADAIVEVDGAAVARPYPLWASWGARTGAFLSRAYADLNELSDEDVLKLQAAIGPRFDLAAIKIDVGIGTVTMREVSTQDELTAAADAAKSKLGRGARTAHFLATAITDLDGRRIEAAEFLALPVKATQALEILYNRVNNASEAELEDFVKAAREPTETARGALT